jgi:uncharacterized protein
MTHITTLDALRKLYGSAKERSVLKELPQLDAHALRLIELSPFVVIATHSVQGAADASPRGGEAGFVKALNKHTLLIADSPGNNRLDSLENIIATGQIGLLFLLPGVDETLRVNGSAVLSTDLSERELCTDRLTGVRRVPALVIRVSVQASYLHCAKALMRSQLWDASRHVQRNTMPSMGEMLRDQIADRVSPGTVFETQEQMLARYQQTL